MLSVLAVWRYYLTFLARRRTFGLALVLALSVGIVPNILAFLFLPDRVLKPLPIAREEEVCELGVSVPAAGIVRGPVDYGKFQDWQEKRELFKGVAATISIEQEQLGGDPNVAGRSLHLGGASVTVAGVMPEAFSQWQREISFWLPVAILPRFAPRELIEKPGYNVTTVIVASPS